MSHENTIISPTEITHIVSAESLMWSTEDAAREEAMQRAHLILEPVITWPTVWDIRGI